MFVTKSIDTKARKNPVKSLCLEHNTVYKSETWTIVNKENNIVNSIEFSKKCFKYMSTVHCKIDNILMYEFYVFYFFINNSFFKLRLFIFIVRRECTLKRSLSNIPDAASAIPFVGDACSIVPFRDVVFPAHGDGFPLL